MQTDAEFDKMCDDFGFLELMKIAAQTNGIGNNYYKKKQELKEKYWQAKQQVVAIDEVETDDLLDSVEHLVREQSNLKYTGVESNPRDTIDKRRKKEEFVQICNIGVLIGYKAALNQLNNK
ncbi:MAG TPA: hypothetical protein PK431_13985 [Chitinophagales bacterium]|nr:hypothetical protein [Chitinophagales bacterium]